MDALVVQSEIPSTSLVAELRRSAGTELVAKLSRSGVTELRRSTGNEV